MTNVNLSGQAPILPLNYNPKSNSRSIQLEVLARTTSELANRSVSGSKGSRQLVSEKMDQVFQVLPQSFSMHPPAFVSAHKFNISSEEKLSFRYDPTLSFKKNWIRAKDVASALCGMNNRRLFNFLHNILNIPQEVLDNWTEREEALWEAAVISFIHRLDCKTIDSFLYLYPDYQEIFEEYHLPFVLKGFFKKDELEIKYLKKVATFILREAVERNDNKLYENFLTKVTKKFLYEKKDVRSKTLRALTYLMAQEAERTQNARLYEAFVFEVVQKFLSKENEINISSLRAVVSIIIEEANRIGNRKMHEDFFIKLAPKIKDLLDSEQSRSLNKNDLSYLEKAISYFVQIKKERTISMLNKSADDLLKQMQPRARKLVSLTMDEFLMFLRGHCKEQQRIRKVLDGKPLHNLSKEEVYEIYHILSGLATSESEIRLRNYKNQLNKLLSLEQQETLKISIQEHKHAYIPDIKRFMQLLEKKCLKKHFKIIKIIIQKKEINCLDSIDLFKIYLYVKEGIKRNVHYKILFAEFTALLNTNQKNDLRSMISKYESSLVGL
ncbi:hypothetical protein PHSC3_001686 [Chlamydiales bacterium STE3]|nr:hypothetical protein PHSC3_001686 [Chlamydiales bacterium STE3]